MPNIEPTPEEVEAFRLGWMIADSMGLEGSRIEAGLRAVKLQQNDNEAKVGVDRVQERINHLRQVIQDSGVNPNYHSSQILRLKTEWPILWDAIQALLDRRDPRFTLQKHDGPLHMTWSDPEPRDPGELLNLSGDKREAECVERWPECFSGGYDPRCCRFPKSCSVRTEP